MARRNENDYIFSSVLIRSKEGSLLKRSDYGRLLEQRELGTALRLLDELGYTGMAALSEDEHEHAGLNDEENALYEKNVGDFEELLDEELRKTYELVLSLTAEDESVRLLLYPNDYHNAKVLLKAEVLGTDPRRLMISNASIAPHSLREAVRKRDFTKLSPELSRGINAALEAFSRSRDPQEIDIILDKACFADMLSEAEKLENAFVSEYLRLLIDIANMSALVRLRRMKQQRAAFSGIFIEGGNVDRSKLEAMYDEAYTQIAERLMPLGYHKFFSVGAETARVNGSFTAMEKIADDLEMEQAKKAKYLPFGLEVAVAYIIAKEAEIKNLRIILAGIRAKTDAARITERLRETYV